jgi:hypothetical protein
MLAINDGEDHTTNEYNPEEHVVRSWPLIFHEQVGVPCSENLWSAGR